MVERIYLKRIKNHLLYLKRKKPVKVEFYRREKKITFLATRKTKKPTKVKFFTRNTT